MKTDQNTEHLVAMPPTDTSPSYAALAHAYITKLEAARVRNEGDETAADPVADLVAGDDVPIGGTRVRPDVVAGAVLTAKAIASEPDLTRRLLKRNGHAFSEIDVVAVELPKEDAFLQACEALLQAELSIHYAYPLLVKPRGVPTVALQTDDIVMAGQILRRRHFTVLAENDLGDNAPGSRPGEGEEPGGPRGY